MEKGIINGFVIFLLFIYFVSFCGIVFNIKKQ